MLRIMFNCNPGFTQSGYANYLADITPRIKDAGHMLAVNAFFGIEGGITEINGIKHYPRLNSPWGDDGMIHNANDFKADTVISIQDVWVLDPNALALIKNWIPHVPIDHDPIPPAVFDRLKAAYRVISCSQFGHEQLKKAGMNSTYIPYTVDLSIFKPQDKVEIRKRMGVSTDAFVFGMVAANKDNPPRKSFQQVMDAFKLFHDKHEEALLYFHVLVDNPQGFPIKEYAKHLGIDRNVMYSPPYEAQFKLTKADMSEIFNSFDCLLAPSTNEGFGVPIIEAQACGVPVITNDFTSMPELIDKDKSGFLVKGLYKRYTPLLSYIQIPDTQDIYEKMEMVFSADRDEMGKAGRAFVAQYDTNAVVKNKWLPFLSMLEDELKIDESLKKA